MTTISLTKDWMKAVNGGGMLGHWGVEAQGKCPPKCQGKMSSRWIAMLADYDTSDVARAMGGLSAFMYFLTVSLCMPSSRAIPRMDSPLRFAFCTALPSRRLKWGGLSESRSHSLVNFCGAVAVSMVAEFFRFEHCAH